MLGAYLEEVIFPQVKELLVMLWRDESVFWTVLPLVVSAVMIQVYFGRNRDESPAWNDLFANAVILTFVTASLFHSLMEQYGNSLWVIGTVGFDKALFAAGFVILGVFLIATDLVHGLPLRLAKIICSPIFMSGLSIIIVVLVQSAVIIDSVTVSAAILVLFVLMGVEKLVRYVIRPSEQAKSVLLADKIRRKKHLHDIFLKKKKRGG
ncbi:MAG TPA: hypothetical protein VJB87_02480 [Candidatus Nanoarchaeia archaeon]|nr:hypothetical protein [Candidatus Nanoarchaeia archaeon]